MITNFPSPHSRKGNSPVSFALPNDNNNDGSSSNLTNKATATIHHPLDSANANVNANANATVNVNASAAPPTRRRNRRGNGNGYGGIHSRSTPNFQQTASSYTAGVSGLSGAGGGGFLQSSLKLPPKRLNSSSSSDSTSKRQQTKQLPRSVRWRLSLGLLTRPMSSPTSNINSGNNNEKEKLLKNIEDLNALKLRCQRSRYNELEKKHYWKSTPVSIADETDGGGGGVTDTNNDGSSNTEGGGGTSMHHVAPGDDPLSSALLSSTTTSDTTPTTATTAKNEASSNLDKSTKLFGGGIFGSGSHPKGGSGVSIRARRRGSNDNPNSSSFNNNNNGNTNGKSSGSILSDSFTSATSSLNDGSDHNTNGGGGGDEAVCKGSRWADFYSTREVLDVIEKDLVRLPANHYTIYHEWRIKNIEWKEDREKEDKWQREQLQKDLEEEDDTLQSLSEGTTIIQMQQQPLGKPLNKKKTNWKLSESFSFGGRKGAKSAENLAALLGADEEDEDEEQKRDENARAEVQNSIKERAGRISQILFVYAREHPEIGYRQGMHEVLSYILLALEMDLLEQAITTERNSWRDNSTSFGLLKDKDSSGKAAHGGMAGVDSSGNLVVVRLLDEKYILHDAFNVFEHIMTSLAPAYDAIPLGDEAAQSILEEAKAERGESPMESMTSSIVSKIRFVARDEQLFGHVLYMPVPPQLYFAKWIRLMFGRELAGGMKNVLRLWDAFFELASARVSTQDDVPVTVALLDVLKTAAASMILLIRHKLLAPSMAPDGTMTGEPDPNNGIGYLMNYPPLEDIGSLVEMISKLLKREQKLSSQHKMLREKTFSQSHTISSIDEHPLEVGERTNASRSRNDPETPPPDDPLSVNLKEDTHGSGERNIFMQTIQDEGPHGYNRVNDGAESYDSQGGQPQPPKHHIKVAESLGHIAAEIRVDIMTAAGEMRQYQVVGRKAGTEEVPNPEAYRMVIFAPNPVAAKSKFWYFMRQFRKMKKTTGEILDCVEIVEKNSRTVKNYGIWLRYDSRSGTHNMYREYRDLKLTGAVSQLYNEMAGRHRCRPRSIQIIRTATLGASELNRPNGAQFAKSNVRFPLPHRVDSAKRGQKALSDRTFSTVRPTTYLG